MRTLELFMSRSEGLLLLFVLKLILSLLNSLIALDVCLMYFSYFSQSPQFTYKRFCWIIEILHDIQFT
jgi:hypothetical protein